MDLKLQGQRALVTGSHRGTGQIIARAFLDEGASVYVHAFSEDEASHAAASLGSEQSLPVWGDITTDEGSAELLSQLAGREPSILINNYGAADGGRWDSSDSDDWIEAYQKNVLSAQRLIHGLLPHLRTLPFGRIINLGTVGSTRPNSRMPGYYAAKGALATMTVSLAKEVAGTSIRVNLVSPGLIRTPEVEAMLMERGQRKGWGNTWEEIEPKAAADSPIGRIATREEVAAAVVFLASPLSDAIHGQNLRIDGGAVDVVS